MTIGFVGTGVLGSMSSPSTPSNDGARRTTHLVPLLLPAAAHRQSQKRMKRLKKVLVLPPLPASMRLSRRPPPPEFEQAIRGNLIPESATHHPPSVRPNQPTNQAKRDTRDLPCFGIDAGAYAPCGAWPNGTGSLLVSSDRPAGSGPSSCARSDGAGERGDSSPPPLTAHSGPP